MKNLILQHWNGELPQWAITCKITMLWYANQPNIGADYKLLTGYPFITPPKDFEVKPWTVIQKIHMISEEYDKYDNVLMLDMDMCATNKGENIFDHEGVGRLHRKSMSGLNNSRSRLWPKLYIQGEPAFFGNCIKLTREERIALRSGLDKKELLDASNGNIPPNDEVILHYLIHKTGALKNKKTLELPHDRFCDLVEEAHPQASLIHYCGNRKNQI